jgi:hypothetical protein
MLKSREDDLKILWSNIFNNLNIQTIMHDFKSEIL